MIVRGVTDVRKGNTVENYVVTVFVLSTAQYARDLEGRFDFTLEVNKAEAVIDLKALDKF